MAKNACLIGAFMVLVCGYASAQLIQNPTFSWTFNPPFQWTFNDNVTGLWPRQWRTAQEANQTMTNDVTSAFQQAMRMSGFSIFAGSLKVIVGGYTPSQNVTINNQNVANTYVPEVGAVTGFRPTATQITPYNQQQQIQVTQNNALFLLRSQWQLVATYLYNILNVQKNVRFVTQISVS